MRKQVSRILVGLGLALLAGACNSPADKATRAPALETDEIADTWLSDHNLPAIGYDNLLVPGDTLQLSPASKSAFDKLPASPLLPHPDTTDSPALAAQQRVRRSRFRLLFTLNNEQQAVVQDDTSATDEATTHCYWGELPEAHQWVVFVGQWEGSHVLLVDQRTGQQTPVWGQPVVSPNKKYLLAYSLDMEAGYNPNGLQLFRVTATGLTRVWALPIAQWGPLEVRWLSNQSVLIKQQEGPLGDTIKPRIGWVHLKMPALH